MVDHLPILKRKPKTVSEILRVIKGLTARHVIDHFKAKNHLASLAKLEHPEQGRNHKYSLWQREKNVLPIFSEGMFMQKVNYIHQNPVREGTVDRALDYRWSSARSWQGCSTEDEPLPVDKDRIKWRRQR